MSFDLSERAGGVLLHPTSLPGAHGSGDTGPQALAFARWLHGAGLRWWQMLPVGPVGYGNSPYSAHSAFAGDPLLVSPDRMVEEGLLSRDALDDVPRFPADRVDYPASRAWRERHLRAASAGLQKREHAELERFGAENADWLDDFTLYAAIKRSRGGLPWTEWEPDLRARDPAALDRARRALREEIRQHRFEQFLFARHWRALREESHRLGVGLIGDLPIFVAHDSADVWAHRELFFLDKQGRPTAVAGVPPDYFSATGQRWGNPLYDWDKMERTGFRWWLARFAHTFALFDAVRLDHFIGFTRYWEIPADEPTAQNGRWRPAPGARLFEALGPAQLIAEDLGAVTPEVTALRERFRFPGIKLLQFAFGTDPQAPTFLPHNYDRSSVAYTGTHDNDTTAGWFHERGSPQRSPDQCEKERHAALGYLGVKDGGREIHWDMMRGVWSSVANLAIAPVQDLLGLGSEARMNLPGTLAGNWEWRIGDLPGPEVQERLRELTALYGRTLL
ncbi:MAG TPA: 4-alpha-glucanotransferase [Myxococcales bacterium]|nr:4-alpha-glucanotransferase [Myxococcales bacterium]